MTDHAPTGPPPTPSPSGPRTVLVQPSSQGMVESLFTFHKNDGIGPKPPQGIMILATHLRVHGFPESHCLDAQLDDLSPEETVERLVAMAPDLVGISVWTDFWHPAWRTIQLVRERLPQAVIVLGGPHCLVYPRETLETGAADYLIAGDGETPLLAIVKNLKQGTSVDETPGLWRKAPDGKVLDPVEPFAIVEDLDAVPAPDRMLLPYKRYHSILTPNAFETTMITSRGCPYKCVFCKMTAQKVYARSAEQVVEEFRQIAELGITDIQVYDDTFSWSPKRVMDICQGIIDQGLEVRWAIRDRVNRVDPEMYALMKKAGCYRVHFGVESGSKPILKASGKGVSLEDAEWAVQKAKDAGFETLAFYMFGFLDETQDDTQKTIDFAIKLDTEYAVFAVLIPYPGTKIYDRALELGVVPTDFWRNFTLNPDANYRIPHLIEQNMTREELMEINNIALRKYYYRPKAIIRELRKLTSWREFRQKSGMAWNILSDAIAPLLGRS